MSPKIGYRSVSADLNLCYRSVKITFCSGSAKTGLVSGSA
jgi:hypothetical protein